VVWWVVGWGVLWGGVVFGLCGGFVVLGVFFWFGVVVVGVLGGCGGGVGVGGFVWWGGGLVWGDHGFDRKRSKESGGQLKTGVGMAFQ